MPAVHLTLSFSSLEGATRGLQALQQSLEDAGGVGKLLPIAEPTAAPHAQVPAPQPSDPISPADVFANAQVSGPLPVSAATAAAVAVQEAASPKGLPEAPTSAPSSHQGLELDSEFIPWDSRIHVTTRAKTKAGVWRVKPGLTEADLMNVKTALRGGAAPSQSMPTFQTIAAAEAAAPVAPPVPAAPVAPPVPAAPVAPPVPAAPFTFAEFVTKTTQHLPDPKAYAACMTKTLSSVGLVGMPDLIAKPDKLPEAFTAFVQFAAHPTA